MNPLLRQQQLAMRTQMLENQAHMLAQRDMLGAAWAADQARQVGRPGRRARPSEPLALRPEDLANKRSSFARVLLWLMALALGAKLIAGL
jgi:hypothetical protein